MTHTSIYREKYNTLLDSGKSYAKSSPVRVSYFDPRTGEPCDTKPQPLTKAEKSKKSNIERYNERIEAENEAAEIMRNMERRKKKKRKETARKNACSCGRPVMVDGVRFESIKAASREIGTDPKWLRQVLKGGIGKCKGRTVELVESEE